MDAVCLYQKEEEEEVEDISSGSACHSMLQCQGQFLYNKVRKALKLIAAAVWCSDPGWWTGGN